MAGAASAATLLSNSVAEAQGNSHIYIVVDQSGGGDYTNLETAVANSPQNCTIFVKAGTYTIQNRIVPKAGMRILGEGYGTHIVAKNGLNNNLFIIFSANVVFESLFVDGNGSNQNPASGSVINFQPPSSNCKVLNCWVANAPGYNLVGFPGCSQLVWVGNHVYNSLEEGIELQGCTDSTVAGNVASGNQIGINLWNSTGDCRGNAVVGNTAVNSALDGIVVQDGAHDNAVVGNTCDGNGRNGIFLSNGGGTNPPNPPNGNTISGNTCLRNGKDGIRIDGASSLAIADNTARNNGAHGVHGAWIESSSISGNILSSNKGCGVRLESVDSNPCRDLVITSNLCRDNGQDSSQPGDGISIYGGSANVIISQNRCFDGQSTKTQKSGVSVYDLSGIKSTNLLLGPNVLDGNLNTGLALNASPAQVSAPTFKRLSNVSVGASEASIPHGLPYTPLSVNLTMRSNGSVWMSSPPDGTNVYLTADGSSRTVDVMVG